MNNSGKVREYVAEALQNFWQGPSGRSWIDCQEKLPPQAEWFRKLADIALRTAANQSGSERAGVDALREALGNRLDELTDAVNTNRALSARVNGKVILEHDKVRAFVLPALATPPAQPAPEATHGKPDGAVREALEAGIKVVNAAFGELVCGAAKYAPEIERQKFEDNFFGPARAWLQVARAALHSPKIAAAETSPGDIYSKQIERKMMDVADLIGDTLDQPSDPRAWDHLLVYAPRDVIERRLAAIDRLDVKAEAKSQEPEAVAIVTYTNYRGETSTRRIIPKSVRYGSTEWHPEPQWLLLAWDDDKQADREFALKDLGPTTKPEAPAVATVSEAATAIAALIAGER